MISLHTILGIVAAGTTFCASLIYIRSILRGQTKPDRITWWVLSFSSGLLAASYYAVGARETIWFPIIYATTFFFIALLSIKYGARGDTNLYIIDAICFVMAIVTAVLWWTTGSALLALFLFMGIEFFGLIPTAYKAFVDPETEDQTAWIVTSFAALINIFAISEWNYAIATYPLYVFITNMIILAFIMLPRGRKDEELT